MRIRIDLARSVATLLALLILLILAPLYPPDRAVAQGTKAPAGAPKLDAGSWALIDADSGLYLAGKDPDKRVPIASTTKTMVALVTLEEGANLNEQVIVSEDAASYAGSVYSNVGLYPYDKELASGTSSRRHSSPRARTRSTPLRSTSVTGA